MLRSGGEMGKGERPRQKQAERRLGGENAEDQKVY